MPLDDSPDSFDPDLAKILERLDAVAARDPQAVARGRAGFLARAERLRARPPRHHFGLAWGRWQFAALKLACILLGIISSASAASVYAAQDALPNEPLYAVKLWSEDVQLALNNDAEARANLFLELANRRAREMSALSARGDAPTEEIFARRQTQIERAWQLAAEMDEPGMMRVLTHAQQSLAQQLQTLDAAAPPLERARATINQELTLTEQGLDNLAGFRTWARAWLKPGAPSVLDCAARDSPCPTVPPLPTRALTSTAIPRATDAPTPRIIPATQPPTLVPPPPTIVTRQTPEPAATPPPVPPPTAMPTNILPTASRVPTARVSPTAPTFPTMPVFPTSPVFPTPPAFPTMPVFPTPPAFPTMPVFPTAPTIRTVLPNPTALPLPQWTPPPIPQPPKFTTPPVIPTPPVFATPRR